MRRFGRRFCAPFGLGIRTLGDSGAKMEFLKVRMSISECQNFLGGANLRHGRRFSYF